MKIIPLTQGKVAFVDDEDSEWLSQWKWRAIKSANNLRWYAIRNSKKDDMITGKRKCIYMHREIVKGGFQQRDHKNGNGLDNRKENLRGCTASQNLGNFRTFRKGTSKFRGVSWYKDYKKWVVVVNFEKKRYFCGYFDSEVEAAKKYNQKAFQLFGEFYSPNLV